MTAKNTAHKLPANDPPMAQPKPLLSILTYATEIEERPTTWIWKPRLPSGLVIVDGKTKEGKSTVMVDIAARVTTGRPMPDGTPGVEPSVVLWLSYEEDAAEDILPRFRAAGGDPRKLVLTKPEATHLIELGPGSQLEMAIVQSGAKLVIIDPLLAAMGRGSKNPREVLSPVTRIGRKHGVCIVGIRHITKAKGRSAIDAGEGATGISSTARAVFLVGKDPADPNSRVLAMAAGNKAGDVASLRFGLVPSSVPDTMAIEWRGETDVKADDLIAPPEPERRGALGEAESFLLAELADGPKLATAVVEAGKLAGHSEPTIDRAKRKLRIKSKKTAGAWLWSLPEPGQGDQGLQGDQGTQGDHGPRVDPVDLVDALDPLASEKPSKGKRKASGKKSARGSRKGGK